MSQFDNKIVITDLICKCTKRHSPAVGLAEVHHIWPKEFGGPDTVENEVAICGTTHNNVHLIIRLYMNQSGVVSSKQLKPFNLYTRNLALKGWQAIQKSDVWIKAHPPKV